MILYVGKEELGFFIAEVASRLKEEVIYMDCDSDISTQVNSILQLAETEHIIYDIDQYTNPAEEIVDIINRIHKTNHATVIILASGYMADSRILMQFRHAGFHNIITATAVADLKDKPSSQAAFLFLPAAFDKKVFAFSKSLSVPLPS